MHRNLSVKSNIIDENTDPCVINILTPEKAGHYSSKEVETWIALLEQNLACNYQDYELTIVENEYLQKRSVKIKFSNIEDATFFKLQRNY